MISFLKRLVHRKPRYTVYEKQAVDACHDLAQKIKRAQSNFELSGYEREILQFHIAYMDKVNMDDLDMYVKTLNTHIIIRRAMLKNRL